MSGIATDNFRESRRLFSEYAFNLDKTFLNLLEDIASSINDIKDMPSMSKDVLEGEKRTQKKTKSEYEPEEYDPYAEKQQGGHWKEFVEEEKNINL
jgi:hypothetical protein